MHESELIVSRNIGSICMQLTKAYEAEVCSYD